MNLNWFLLGNSLLLAGLATLLASLFGLLASLWLAGLARRWRLMFLSLAVTALATPPFLVTNCWLHFLGHSGVWRGWLPLSIFSIPGAAWILSLLFWPITLISVLTAWRRLEPHQLEADPALSSWPLLCYLLFPLARAALGQAAILTFVLALNNFAVPAILQVKVFPAEMWIRFNTEFDTRGALLLSWPLILGPLLMLLWLARRPIPWPHLESPVTPGFFRRQLGAAWFWTAGTVTILVCALSVGLPLYQILFTRRTWTELPGALAAGQNAIWNSFWLAGLSAALIVIVPVIAMHDKKHGRRSGLLDTSSTLAGSLLWIPFLLPGVLLGIGLIHAFNRPSFELFYTSASIVILAFTIRYLAVGWNTVAHARQSVDPNLTDVARIEGANRWQILWHVQWPQIRPRLAAAAYIVFLLCLWDVESTVLIVPPGGETLALRIFNLLHYGHNAQVNALCLALLLVALAPLLAWSVIRALLRACCTLRGPFGTTTPHAPRNTHDGAHTTPHATLLALTLTTLLLTSCFPSSSTSSLQSRLFSRVEIIGSRGVGVGQLNKPRSVAIDLHDNLFVVDMTGRVQKFSPEGRFLLSWQMPQTELGKPKGMARDCDGDIVVLEPHYSRVNHFSPDGALVLQWGRHGTNFGQLSLPRAITVNSRREIFVSDYQGVERVQKFKLPQLPKPEPQRGESNPPTISAPQCEESFGHPGTRPGEFNRPEGLCVDQQDRLYVADSCNHRIQIFSSEGKFLRAYGRPGKGPGELSYPYDICIDSAGRQYVCEFGNSRIQVFDANDKPIEILGAPGAEPGRFSNPWGVALDSAGNLYVADSQNHRVQKFIRR